MVTLPGPSALHKRPKLTIKILTAHKMASTTSNRDDLLPKFYHDLWLHSGKVWAPGEAQRGPKMTKQNLDRRQTA